MPEAGANPFRSNTGGSARVLLAQAASGAVAVTVALPSAVGVALGALGWAPGPWLALVVGPAAGVVVLVIAIQVGGQVVDRRGPEILAAVRKSQ
jgi:ABC-2 type transport system permease protein